MIYFKNLGEAYIQAGTYQLQKKYRQGHVHVQGMENIVGDTDPANLKNLPEYFVNDWAQFMYPVPDSTAPNHEDMYDRGAYSVGVPVQDIEYLNIPRFRKVTLFYFHTTNVNNETREVVQFEPQAFIPYQGTKADGTTGTVTAAEFVKILSSKYFESEGDYYDWLNSIGALRGFNRNAKAYPPAVTKSAVSELASYKGQVDTDNNGTLETVTIHVTPMYIQNGFPIFDLVYFHNDTILTEDGKSGSDESLQSGRLLRWYGGFTSEFRAPINFDDHSQGGVNIATGSSLNGADRPLLDDNIVVDGETYLNANSYNVTKRLN